MAAFTKHGSPHQLRWEETGLAWLRDAGADHVVEVLGHSGGVLIEERLVSTPPSANAAEEFAVALHRVHTAGAPAFGAGPPGWDDAEPGWIGMARLPLGSHHCWGEFYAELRLLPHARAAHARGSLSSEGVQAVEAVCQRLRDGEFDDGRPPARIHGDLWGGNLISTARGLVMIDPAAHGGHGETDLAMLALFGYPQLRRVQQAYAEAAALDSDWPDRVGLHQLHPLLVHAELFGAGYGRQAAEIARQYA